MRPKPFYLQLLILFRMRTRSSHFARFVVDTTSGARMAFGISKYP